MFKDAEKGDKEIGLRTEDALETTANNKLRFYCNTMMTDGNLKKKEVEVVVKDIVELIGS
jgi:hypothetical protein